jgi:hypothetical protein
MLDWLMRKANVRRWKPLPSNGNEVTLYTSVCNSELSNVVTPWTRDNTLHFTMYY